VVGAPERDSGRWAMARIVVASYRAPRRARGPAPKIAALEVSPRLVLGRSIAVLKRQAPAPAGTADKARGLTRCGAAGLMMWNTSRLEEVHGTEPREHDTQAGDRLLHHVRELAERRRR